MKTKLTFLPFLALTLLGACAGPVKQDENGVTVKVQQPVENGPALVRLEVMGEKLIRVSATPEKKFADPQSLVVLPSSEKTQFEVTQNGETVTVATSSVKANVSTVTGEVWFTDAEGNMILQEQKGGGKSFEPIEVEGTRGYSFRQVFESPEDEAYARLAKS